MNLEAGLAPQLRLWRKSMQHCLDFRGQLCAADPHPGNISVTPAGELIYYDWGMVGTIPSDIRAGLLELFYGVYEKVGLPGLNVLTIRAYMGSSLADECAAAATLCDEAASPDHGRRSTSASASVQSCQATAAASEAGARVELTAPTAGATALPALT